MLRAPLVFGLLILTIGCGGRVSDMGERSGTANDSAGSSASSASAFMGTWLCGSIGATPGPVTITASGDQITETTAQMIIPDPLFSDASVTITCTEVLTVSGTTATLDPGSTTCTGAADVQVPEPSSDIQTVNGNTMTIVVSYPDSSPATAVCTKE
jgi:hypothetical protein